MSGNHICTLSCIEMSKEKLETSEGKPPVWLRRWALPYSHHTPYNFQPVSNVKKRPFSQFFSWLWVSFGKFKLG